MDGVDTSSSASRVATEDGVVGNTQYVANIISQEMGDDLYRIETVQTYPKHMIRYWNLLMKNVVKMQDQN